MVGAEVGVAEVYFTRGAKCLLRGTEVFFFATGRNCLLRWAEVPFHEGPKCFDEGPKCLAQKGPKWSK